MTTAQALGDSLDRLVKCLYGQRVALASHTAVNFTSESDPVCGLSIEGMGTALVTDPYSTLCYEPTDGILQSSLELLDDSLPSYDRGVIHLQFGGRRISHETRTDKNYESVPNP